MAWSVQIPNPLTVGGNGDIGEIEVLDANGTPIIIIGITGPPGAEHPAIRAVSTLGSEVSIEVVGIPPNAPSIFFKASDGIGIGTAAESSHTYWDGASFSTSSYALDIAMKQLGESVNDVPNISLQRSSADNIARIVVNKQLVATNPAAGTPNYQYYDPEIWHAVGFQNGWSNLGAPYANVSYRLKPDGYVAFQGGMLAGTTADFTQLFNALPAAYRPTALRIVNVAGNAAGATPEFAIDTGGNVLMLRCGAATALWLDGVQYPL